MLLPITLYDLRVGMMEVCVALHKYAWKRKRGKWTDRTGRMRPLSRFIPKVVFIEAYSLHPDSHHAYMYV